MSYAITDIIEWAKISQALAAIGEQESKANTGSTVDEDLHIKLYIERKSLEWEYAQDPTSENLFLIGNWVLALCGVYLFKAQLESGNPGGSVSPINPSGRPQQLNFTVAASGTPLVDGDTTKTFSSFIGYNLTVVKSSQPLDQVTTKPIYYTWNRDTGAFFLNQATITTDEWQITPV